MSAKIDSPSKLVHLSVFQRSESRVKISPSKKKNVSCLEFYKKRMGVFLFPTSVLFPVECSLHIISSPRDQLESLGQILIK